MSCGEGPVAANDRGNLRPNVRLQEISGHLAMASISENLANVMAKRRQDDLVVSTRPFRTGCRLQSMFQLADLPSVTYLRQARETDENTLGPATLSPDPVHVCRIRGIQSRRIGAPSSLVLSLSL